MDTVVEARVNGFLKDAGYVRFCIYLMRKPYIGGKPSQIVAITDQGCVQFDLKGNMKNCNSWVHVTRITRIERTVMLHWGRKEFGFDESECETVNAIYDVLQRVLFPRELEKIKFPDMKARPLSTNALGFLARFREEARLRGKSLSDAFVNGLTSVLKFSQKLIPNELPDFANHADILMAALPVMSMITDMSIIATQSLDVFATLAKTGLPPDLLRLEVVSAKMKTFPVFVEKCKNLKIGSKLVAIAFRDMELGNEHLQLLVNVVEVLQLKSLEFHNAVAKDAISAFYAAFMPSRKMDSVDSVSFSGSDFVVSATAFQINTTGPTVEHWIQRISMLSLAGCKVDVGQMLGSLERCQNLAIVDLSGNQCGEAPTTIPPNLRTLIARNVDWECSGLNVLGKVMLRVCDVKYPTPLILDVSEAVVSNWSKVYEYFDDCQSARLYSLNWSKNKVDEQFFKYLKGNRWLTSLSMSECIGNSRRMISSLCGYLLSQRTLSKFVMQGSENMCVGGGVVNILDAIGKKGIHVIDLEGSEAGDVGVAAFYALLLNGRDLSVKEVAFDGLKPNNVKGMAAFITGIAQLKGLRVTFPCKDVESLRSVSDEAAEIIDSAAEALRIQGSDTLFDPPFHLYGPRDTDVFPRFVTTEDVAATRRPLLLPPEHQEDPDDLNDSTSSPDSSYDDVERRSPVKPSLRATQPVISKVLSQSSGYAPTSGDPTQRRAEQRTFPNQYSDDYALSSDEEYVIEPERTSRRKNAHGLAQREMHVSKKQLTTENDKGKRAQSLSKSTGGAKRQAKRPVRLAATANVTPVKMSAKRPTQGLTFSNSDDEDYYSDEFADISGRKSGRPVTTKLQKIRSGRQAPARGASVKRGKVISASAQTTPVKSDRLRATSVERQRKPLRTRRTPPPPTTPDCMDWVFPVPLGFQFFDSRTKDLETRYSCRHLISETTQTKTLTYSTQPSSRRGGKKRINT